MGSCWKPLRAYLESQGNSPEEIRRLERVLTMPTLILEIGAGDGGAAWQIATRNPGMGVIATDIYDWDCEFGDCSRYRKTALMWREKRLDTQRATPSNMVLLRARAEILGFFPDRFLDSVLLINPEPKVVEAFLVLADKASWLDKIKPGVAQILVLPYSRSMGISAYGGFEFDHTNDWSRGLGFLMSGPLKFRRGERLHWGLDLCRLSGYTRNSTQTDIYIYGNKYEEVPVNFWQTWIKRIF